jgi:mannose-6-phosphate isomerase-like protein (cupin superfamily)
MKNSTDFINSGIIQSYVLGIATSGEITEVEAMASIHPEVRKALDSFSEAIEKHALANAVQPHAAIKPFLMATIDYMSRMEKGETMSFPPVLHERSQIADYAEWLNNPDMILPADFKDVHAKIIGFTPEVSTAIVWLKDMAPAEVHHNEFEKFLIVEGSCDITIGKQVYQLVPGDYLSIPLYEDHNVRVTSNIPCKIILQRIAA